MITRFVSMHHDYPYLEIWEIPTVQKITGHVEARVYHYSQETENWMGEDLRWIFDSNIVVPRLNQIRNRAIEKLIGFTPLAFDLPAEID